MVSFLNDELDIDTNNVSVALHTLQKMELNYLTSLINVEGNIKMFVAFSYDECLFNEVFSRYTAELEIDEHEHDEAIVDSAGDIVNIIVGNTLADFNDSKQKIIMSPPIVITGAKQIGCSRSSVFYGANIATDYGRLDIFLVNSLDELKEGITHG
jgi:CheY-specific phosphatase CheX